MKAISNSGSFTDFLNSSYIYIDKTETIYKLLTMQKKVFISRPRRFGKSLTLDTIGTLFEKGVDPYFKNTWIYDKWSESSLPVLRIDFLKFSVTDINEFKSQFVLCVSNFARKHNVTGYLENNDVVRVTGYLVKKSELAKLDQNQQSLNNCSIFGVGARDTANALDRRVEAYESAD